MLTRGAFRAHVAGRVVLADAGTAVIAPAGVEYRISHPGDHGDHGVVLELADELADELRVRGEVAELAISARGQRELPLPPRGDDLDDEAALVVVHAVLGRAPRRAPHAGERPRIARAVRELLERELAHNLPVTELARRVGCSPFHLMRMFRDETGHSVRGYRAWLRVAAAAAALRDGREDVAALAVEVGFASHQHLCTAMRAALGCTPREVRARSWKRGRRPQS